MPGVQQGLIGSYAAAAPAVPLPVGTILIFNRTSGATPIPTNFSLYTDQGGSIEGYLIQGGTSVSRVTGTAANVTLSPTTFALGSAGTHSGPGNIGGGSTLAPGRLGTVNAGAHTHNITIAAGSQPFPVIGSNMGQQMPLIRCDTESAVIPAGCLIFSSSSSLFTGFSRYSGTQPRGVFSIRPAASGLAQNLPFPANLGGQPGASGFGPSMTTTTDGNHTHVNPSPTAGPTGAPPPNNGPFTGAPVNHNHSASGPTGGFFGPIGVWQQYKHLLPNVSASDQTVSSGMIIMFNSNTIPDGWLVCDGTNGTPDMRGFFLGYDNAQNNTNVVTSRRTVGGSDPGPGTTPAPPPTAYGQNAIGATLPEAQNLWSHGHLATTSPFGPVANPGPSRPASHNPSFNPHTHAIPTNIFATFPSNYVPAHVVLIFLQKS